jgi:hypothetical protein
MASSQPQISTWSATALGLSGQTAAGTATGGSVTVTVLPDSTITIDNGLGTSRASLVADAYGSPGPFPADATGGTVQLVANDGSLSVSGDLLMSADARMAALRTPGPNGPGFDATGGTVTIDQVPGAFGTALIGATTIAATAIGDARATFAGGAAFLGDGGTGLGGNVTLTEDAGGLTATSLTLDTSGYGGASAATGGATPFQSGAGVGGRTEMVQNAGTVSVATIALLSGGHGGGGGPDASGDRACRAGRRRNRRYERAQTSSGGTINATDTALRAAGTGGAGMDHGGDRNATDGGAGTGGTVQLLVPSGWAGALNSSATLTLAANGVGGVGGLSAGAGLVPPTASNADGGDGLGGTAVATLADGMFALGATRVEAIGSGGDSADASSGIPEAKAGSRSAARPSST